MKRRFQWRGLITLVAVLIFAEPVIAEQPEAQRAVSSPDVALETILREWQRVNSTIDRIDTRLNYILYDDVFRGAYEGQGLLSVDRSGCGFYKIESRVHQAGVTPPAVRRTSDGQEFPVRSASPECWYWTGTSVIQVDEANRRYVELAFSPEVVQRLSRHVSSDRPAPPPLPEDARPNPVLSWLSSSFELAEIPLARPFLLEMSADEMQSRYQITLLQQNADEVRLRFVPKSQTYERFRSAVLILTKSDYQPKALQLTNINKTEVYVFSGVRINQPHAPPFGDLQRPNLEGYRPPIKSL